MQNRATVDVSTDLISELLFDGRPILDIGFDFVRGTASFVLDMGDDTAYAWRPGMVPRQAGVTHVRFDPIGPVN